MFETLAATVIATVLLGVVADDGLYQLLSTTANLATVALLVWHQRHIRREIEPEVKETATVVKRRLGTRNGNDQTYHGSERRKGEGKGTGWDSLE